MNCSIGVDDKKGKRGAGKCCTGKKEEKRIEEKKVPGKKHQIKKMTLGIHKMLF